MTLSNGYALPILPQEAPRLKPTARERQQEADLEQQDAQRAADVVKLARAGLAKGEIESELGWLRSAAERAEQSSQIFAGDKKYEQRAHQVGFLEASIRHAVERLERITRVLL